MKRHDPLEKRKSLRTKKHGPTWPGRMRRGMQRMTCVFATLLGCSLIAAHAQANPLISEVYYDAPGSDNGFVFVELYGTPGSLLDGLTLEGVNGANGDPGPILTLSGVFPSDGIFVVADQDSTGGTFVSEVDLLLNFDFQNGPDSIRLLDAGMQLDAVGYGVFSPTDFFAGEGAAAPDAPAGSSLARVFADFDSDDNEFDFVVLSQPTPGYADFSVVPEPGSGILSALGLAMLAKIYRRSSARRT